MEELNAIASTVNTTIKYVTQHEKENPFLVVELPNEDSARKVASRAISIRSLYEVWATDKTYEGLIGKLKQLPKEFIVSRIGQLELEANRVVVTTIAPTPKKPYLRSDQTFCLNVETYNRKLQQEEKLQKIMSVISVLEPEAKVKLKDPDTNLHLFEYWRGNPGPKDTTNQPEEIYLGRWIADGFRDTCRRDYSLKTRCFIGNTSMDPFLAMIMANMAQVKRNDLVLDPFVGTGSLLVASAHFGAFVMGTDIDYQLLHAKAKPSRHNQKMRAPEECIAANMRQYGLQSQYLDVLIADAAKGDIYRDGLKFDAVITDPPYGLRESTRTIGPKKAGAPQIPEEEKTAWIPTKSKYQLSDIYKDLLNFAAKSLVLGGRLVYWLPIIRPDYKDTHVPCHPCFTLVSNCEQGITTQIGRRLITMEKTQEYKEDMQAYLEEDHFEDNAFREKAFLPPPETKKDRKLRSKREKRAKHKHPNPETECSRESSVEIDSDSKCDKCDLEQGEGHLDISQGHPDISQDQGHSEVTVPIEVSEQNSKKTEHVTT